VSPNSLTVVPLTTPANFTIGSPISPVPVDALDQTQLWSGYIPYEELPAIQDPSSGVLATANARITPDDYPYALTLDWPDAYRVERIDHLLEGHTGLTPQAMLAIQTDQHSEFDLVMAHRIAYAIDHASKSARGSDAARLRQAADLLRSWNGEMSAGSPAAAIVSAAHAELWPALLAPQILAHDGGSANDAAAIAQLYRWSAHATALESLLQHRPSRWLPPGVSSWSDLLTTAVERGLRNSAPRDLAHWQYGAIHRMEIQHPLFAGRPWLAALLGTATGSGVQPIGGDATTINASGRSFGASERFTADLADSEATLANLTTGESGSPASPWYLDQFLPWLHGTSQRLPLKDAGAEHTLTLLPSA
jgi:penicillin amidase